MNHQRQKAVVVGEQRLYLRLQDVRWFRIAPFDGVQIPSAEAFGSFEAYDYSRDGFSFWALEKPTSELIVVELEYRKRRNYHEARVMHLTQADREGITWHLVGCRFSQRLEPISLDKTDPTSPPATTD